MGKTRAPAPSRWATMISASVLQSAPICASGSRLAVYWTTTCGICSLLFDRHRRHRATDREDRDRRVVANLAAPARSSGDGDEGSDLEAALAGFAVGRRIGVVEQRLAVVARPAVEELA